MITALADPVNLLRPNLNKYFEILQHNLLFYTKILLKCWEVHAENFVYWIAPYWLIIYRDAACMYVFVTAVDSWWNGFSFLQGKKSYR